MTAFLVTLVILESFAILCLCVALYFLDPLKRFWTTIRQRPYLQVVIRNSKTDEDGMVKIEAEHNYQFLLQLDQAYSRLGAAVDWDARMPDHAKIAIFISDITSDVAEPYRNDVAPREPEDTGDAPPMYLNGGQEVRQVIDIANAIQRSGKGVDLQRG